MLIKGIGERTLFVKHYKDKTAMKRYLGKGTLKKTEGVRLYKGGL